MKQYTATFCALLFLALGVQSCVNSTSIGAELLEEDELNLTFTDTISITTFTAIGDSVRTFSPLLSLQLPQMLVGDYVDPVFGRVQSSIYAQSSLNGAGPDFTGVNIDSVILVLPYLTDSDYGVINENFDIQVLQLTQDINADSSLSSNVFYETQSTAIGELSFVPRNAEIDSLEILQPKNDTLGFDTLLVVPHLRIPLTSAFTNDLLMTDQTNYSTDSLFKAFFKGMQIKTVNETEGLLGFNLRTSMGTGEHTVFSGISVYYHTDTTNVLYRFPFASGDAKVASYQHDYAGAVCQEFLDDTAQGDSLFFIQGLAGVNGIIEFPFIDELKGKNILINKAELVLSVAELPEDTGDFDKMAQLTIAEIGLEEGLYLQIEDVARATTTDQFLNSSLSSAEFGGNFVEAASGIGGTYTMNITAYMQSLLKDEVNNKLRISTYNKSRFASRAAFYGGKHSTNPVKLRLYYTEF